MLAHRVEALLQGGVASSLDALLFAVEAGDPVVLDALDATVTTSHTFFWREPHHFAHLEAHALPAVIAERRRARALRVWCAAAATGQEAYTLVACLERALGAAYGGWDAGVLATDVSVAALEVADRAVYAASDVRRLPPVLQRHLVEPRAEGGYAVRPSVRREVLLRWLNLAAPSWPLRAPMDILFCRNVLMYFDAPTRAHVVSRLHGQLAPRGWLYVGTTEALVGARGLFESHGAGIYRRLDPIGSPRHA